MQFEWRLQSLFKLGMDRDLQPFLDHADRGRSLVSLNLGHGSKKMPAGTSSVGLPEWNAEFDVLPYRDGEIDEIWALHFLEHIHNVTFVLRECERVLTKGGTLNIVVPYGMTHCAIQDITHVHRFNEDTWKTLFSNPYYDPELGDTPTSWNFEVQSNFICGIKGENLALFTQLVKV